MIKQVVKKKPKYINSTQVKYVQIAHQISTEHGLA